MDSKEDILRFIIGNLTERMSKTVVETWFSDAQLVLLTEAECIISTSSDFKRDILSSRYTQPVEDALLELFGAPVRAGFITSEEASKLTPTEKVCTHRDFNFEGFIVGESNKFAASCAQAVAKSPGKIYNPLFIYGESGLGKTHLLYAIMNRIAEDYSHYVIRDFTGETFTNELVTAIRTNTTPEFREKYRTPDMILVDDIQFISGKDFSQDEFFHTFNSLYQVGSQIVVTSDRPPKDMPLLEERLRSRFDSGILVDIQPPDFETRMAIIKAKALRLGLHIPDEVVVHIAESITRNIRQLEGSVKKLLVYRDLHSGPVSIEDAQKAINDLKRDSPGLNPTPQFILQKVCEYFKVEERAVLGSGRQDKLVNARHVAMYLIRTMTDTSLQIMGRDIFRRDHSTVKYGVDRITEEREKNTVLDNHIKAVLENIKNS